VIVHEVIRNGLELGERIQTLKRRAASNHDVELYARRSEIYGRVWCESTSVAPVLRTARALARFLTEKELKLTPDDVLAGGEQFYDFSVPLEAEHAGLDARRAGLLATFRHGYRVGLFCGGLGGHVIAGYHRVLEQGLGALAAAADRRLRASTGAERHFAQASLLVCQAASAYARRYAARAQELARDAATDSSRERLQRIAAACEWIATEPPRSSARSPQQSTNSFTSEEDWGECPPDHSKKVDFTTHSSTAVGIGVRRSAANNSATNSAESSSGTSPFKRLWASATTRSLIQSSPRSVMTSSKNRFT
jgi:hypothetical protein